jgi:adenylate cyclase
MKKPRPRHRGSHLAAETKVLRLAIMFTDIVNSTTLLVALGDETWLRLLRWHDAVLRSCFRTHDGHEVNQTGDGFFTVFEQPLAALQCALDVQRRLADGRNTDGYGVHVRIGIQWVDVIATPGNYVGHGVHEAARINEIAGADEILVSLAALEAAGGRFHRSVARPVNLRGFPEPFELVSLYG